MRLTQRIDALGTESAFEVAAAARRLEAEGRDIVHLEIGEPGIPTPAHIVEAGVRALRNGLTRYVPPAGIPELRDAIAASVAARGITARAEDVVVTSGAKPMLLYAALALVQPGDEVLIPDPGFPIYESVVRFAGGTPIPYAIDLTGGSGRTAAAVIDAVTPRTRVLILNAPHNPTGCCLAPVELDALAELCHARDIAVISDEVYGSLRYSGRHESIASRPGMAQRTVVIDSFSKTYAMTGWRLGFGVMPAALARHVATLVVNSTSCAPPFVQHAGVAALTGPQDVVRELVATLRLKRDALVRGLGTIDGLTCATPPAAFYAFPDLSDVLATSGLTTTQFADHLLTTHGVATLAGTGFGARGAGHIRLSFAASAAALDTALQRLRACVRELATSCSPA